MTSDSAGASAAQLPNSDVVDLLIGRSIGVDGEQESLVARIARETAKDIIEGRIAPGTELTSIDLAERFDTSRTPPREALLVLEREGLVEIRPRRRPRVVFLPRQTVKEIYELRAILYEVVARRIVSSADDHGLLALRSNLEHMKLAAATGRYDSYFWANVMFHETASVLTGDQTLKRAIDSLGVRVLQLRHFGMTVQGRVERSAVDHERLMLALEERESDLAAALNSSIVRRGLESVMAVYDAFEALAD